MLPDELPPVMSLVGWCIVGNVDGNKNAWKKYNFGSAVSISIICKLTITSPTVKFQDLVLTLPMMQLNNWRQFSRLHAASFAAAKGFTPLFSYTQ